MLEAVKRFLRIDDLLEGQEIIDQQLEALITAAKSYIKNAGVNIDNISNQELFELCVFLLVAHWWEHREAIGEAKKMAYSLDAILMQLIYCADNEII